MANVFSSALDAAVQPAQFSDDALALKFPEIHGNDLRYTAPWGRWSRFDGTCWKLDDSLCVSDLARALCRTAASGEKPTTASRIFSARTIEAVERLACADRRHAATVDQWDADPWLLNTPGGVIDLHTGELRPVARRDYMTKITAAAPSRDYPRWKTFLSQITGGDEELQHFLQRMCGYALTGVTWENALFFLHGQGGNGKGVFLNTISGILGGYARTAPIETFIASTSERHPTDLAGLLV
jgi:putative DNA primase/helicase